MTAIISPLKLCRRNEAEGRSWGVVRASNTLGYTQTSVTTYGHRNKNSSKTFQYTMPEESAQETYKPVGSTHYGKQK